MIEQQENETIEDALAKVKALVNEGIRAAEACRQVAKDTQFSKGELYQALLEEE